MGRTITGLVLRQWNDFAYIARKGYQYPKVVSERVGVHIPISENGDLFFLASISTSPLSKNEYPAT
jgi:hypothetical protein